MRDRNGNFVNGGRKLALGANEIYAIDGKVE